MKKEKIVFLVLLTLVVITGLMVTKAYSRYLSEATGTGSATVADWVVEINGTDVTGAGTTDFGTITFTEVANPKVVDGKIAPSTSMTATFEIDPTGSEVAIDYVFSLGTITASSGSVPSSLTITGVEANGSTVTDDGSGNYTGTIDLASQNAALTADDKVTIVVTITWENDEDNNVTDTATGVAAPTLSIPVTVTVKQSI